MTQSLQPPLTEDQIAEQKAIQAWADSCNRAGELVWLGRIESISPQELVARFGSLDSDKAPLSSPVAPGAAKHIHGSDQFTLDNVAASLEAALAKHKLVPHG